MRLQRTDDELEFALFEVDEIGLQRQCAPAIDAAQTHLFLVDADIGEGRWLDVGRVQIALVRAFVEALDGVV